MTVRAAVQMVLIFGEGAARGAGIDDYEPPDRSHFGVHAQVFIGDTATGYVDSFDLVVCTPSWMAEQVAEGHWSRFRHGGLSAIPDAIAVGSGIWFMQQWDRAAFQASLTEVCDSCSPAPDWGSLASRIGRLIPWEFDYKYDEHVDAHYGEPFPPPRR